MSDKPRYRWTAYLRLWAIVEWPERWDPAIRVEPYLYPRGWKRACILL